MCRLGEVLSLSFFSYKTPVLLRIRWYKNSFFCSFLDPYSIRKHQFWPYYFKYLYFLSFEKTKQKNKNKNIKKYWVILLCFRCTKTYKNRKINLFLNWFYETSKFINFYQRYCETSFFWCFFMFFGPFTIRWFWTKWRCRLVEDVKNSNH